MNRGIAKTPLRYDCLHEADSFGINLGPVGGTLVTGMLVRLMARGPESILCSAHDITLWEELGATAQGTFSLRHRLATIDAKCVETDHAGDLITKERIVAREAHSCAIGFRPKRPYP